MATTNHCFGHSPSETQTQSGGIHSGRNLVVGLGGSYRWVGLLCLCLTPLTGCQWANSGKNAQGAQLYQQGQYTAALQKFQEVIAADPSNPDGYYNLAATTHRLAKQRQDAQLFAQSEALYNQCLDHSPNHVECHRGLAVLLADTNRPDRAFALMKTWASQNPALAEPRIELARLYEEYGEPQTALKYLEDAVLTDANNSRAWLALARLRESSGELTQALQNYQRALALNGAQPMVAERIAAISRQLNSNLDAARYGNGTQIATQGPLSTRY
ncbi:tetratricopeptide repeat protein [Stieleria varia]|uniref:Photosystem I assembly protein Ycf3 n=1 Tax=Stieleria varia TaxID=2528005 RepID=A0A5C6ARR9_9BACT|nr:tetratricopeptide repeat protein [Stieleria varia]TWU00864.1 photosystem I assembly protein Ycf3 [Stieleria varia]